MQELRTDMVMCRRKMLGVAGVVAAALLAGAFDPRVLDADDLVSLGTDYLGRLPPLAAARGPVGRAPRAARVYSQ